MLFANGGIHINNRKKWRLLETREKREREQYEREVN